MLMKNKRTYDPRIAGRCDVIEEVVEEPEELKQGMDRR
jgi:hypothetical protein